jgi:acetyltransferase-like isoleucine patch superfamily enzyme
MIFPRYIYSSLNSILNGFKVEYPVYIKNSKISPKCRIKRYSEIINSTLGPNVRIGFLSTIYETIIGENTYLNRNSSATYCEIGEGCAIARNTTIGAIQHDIESRRIQDTLPLKKTWIGDDVWLGVNAVIMPGVSVGDGAVIGAGSVVTHDVPDYMVFSGVPAKPLKERIIRTCNEEKTSYIRSESPTPIIF